MLVSHLYIFFKKNIYILYIYRYIQVFYPFLSQVISFFDKLLIYFDINPLLVILCANIFSHSVGCLFALSVNKEYVEYMHDEILPSHKTVKIVPFATTCMDLKGIMPSEISPTEKDKYCYHLYVESKN